MLRLLRIRLSKIKVFEVRGPDAFAFYVGASDKASISKVRRIIECIPIIWATTISSKTRSTTGLDMSSISSALRHTF